MSANPLIAHQFHGRKRIRLADSRAVRREMVGAYSAWVRGEIDSDCEQPIGTGNGTTQLSQCVFERVLLIGIRSAEGIRASGIYVRRVNRPDTWQHRLASCAALLDQIGEDLHRWASRYRRHEHTSLGRATEALGRYFAAVAEQGLG
jgi:hypothetical protein